MYIAFVVTVLLVASVPASAAYRAFTVRSNNGRMPNPSLPAFPDPVTFHLSRPKWMEMVVVAVLSAAVFCAMSFDQGAYAVIGPIGALLCSAGAVMGTVIILPGSSSLNLDRDGFTVTKFFRSCTYRWGEVSDFSVLTVPIGKYENKMVVFSFPQPRLGWWDKVNVALTGGRNGYLPDTYGLSADDLLKLLTSWRDLAVNSLVIPQARPTFAARRTGNKFALVAGCAMAFVPLLSNLVIWLAAPAHPKAPSVSIYEPPPPVMVSRSLAKCELLFPTGQGAVPGINCLKSGAHNADLANETKY